MSTSSRHAASLSASRWWTDTVRATIPGASSRIGPGLGWPTKPLGGIVEPVGGPAELLGKVSGELPDDRRGWSTDDDIDIFRGLASVESQDHGCSTDDDQLELDATHDGQLSEPTEAHVEVVFRQGRHAIEGNRVSPRPQPQVRDLNYLNALDARRPITDG